MKRWLLVGLVLVGGVSASANVEYKPIRPPAVPLVSVDPHFSLWCIADTLTERNTAFWVGHEQPFRLYLKANGSTYRLCGKNREGEDFPALTQTVCRVGATISRFEFAGPNNLAATVEFCTPRIADDLDVFSRPVTYVSIKVAEAEKFTIEADIDNSFATCDKTAPMVRSTYNLGEATALMVGRLEQTPFSKKGDRLRADWGYAHLVGPIAEADGGTFLLAYDDLKSVRFFGKDLVAWWRRDGKEFKTMLGEALSERKAILDKCRAFDEEFAADMLTVGGMDYVDVATLAWRQSYAACKCVAGSDGETFLFSNECGSGGMIGTTDVFYPQLPHLLMTSLTLAKGSLAPTCIYASSTNWPYAYAPHDLGLFPVAEGQYYAMKKGQAQGGRDDDASRMPVEECGNMLISLAAIAEAEGHAGFASRWWPTVSGWAKYLEQFGFDPGDQLCTDDFAGHLAHNANLSIKTIEALAAYGRLSEMRGEKAVAAKYRQLAKELAVKWCEAAKGGRHGAYRLAFDRADSWSLKYNLIWDTLLGFKLFPPEVAVAELKAYRAEALAYGVPLDSRSKYTKADWLVWAGALTARREDLEFMVGGIRRYLNDTRDRFAFCDWYWADKATRRGFMARSVVGGVFLPVLRHPELLKKYRHR